MTGYTKLALRYRQGMTAFPPPGLAYLTGYAPMLYTRCGMTAAWGRRFDESYGNNGNYEIYEISAPPEISRAGKKARSQYPWVKYRGAPQYRQGMTAFPPPPAGQGGVMVLPATGRRPRELSDLTGYTKLALHAVKAPCAQM